MDPSKIYKFLIEYIVDWSYVTFLTLTKPISRFDLVPVNTDEKIGIIGVDESQRKYWLHPRLMGFAVLSIILGLAINAMIPARKPGPELLASTITIFIYWIISASVLHLFCKLLRGRGKYLETLNVAVQISATLYVINSFLSFIVASILLMPEVSFILKDLSVIGEIIAEEPVYTFFIIGTLLSMIYVPLSMKPIHGFGWLRTCIIAILPPVTVWLPIMIYIVYGLLVYAPMAPMAPHP